MFFFPGILATATSNNETPPTSAGRPFARTFTTSFSLIKNRSCRQGETILLSTRIKELGLIRIVDRRLSDQELRLLIQSEFCACGSGIYRYHLKGKILYIFCALLGDVGVTSSTCFSMDLSPPFYLVLLSCNDSSPRTNLCLGRNPCCGHSSYDTKGLMQGNPPADQ